MLKNSTFHFTTSNGEMGIIQLGMDSEEIEELSVTEVAGPLIKMLGACGLDKIAMAYYNQMVLLISSSDKNDEYTNVVINKLKDIPKKVLNHRSEPYFLVQESSTTSSLWTTLLSEVVWRQDFDSEICYMKFSEKRFYIGCSNGNIHIFSFN
jgi:hypothetical protein